MPEKLKVLVAEDDKSVVALYEIGFAGEEVELRIAADGGEALKAYLAWKPDILLLDIMLPEMSGYTVLKEIRQGNHDGRTTIVMITSKSGKEDVLDCLKLGIQGYIVKPFKYSEIKEKVLEHHYRHQASFAAPEK